MVSAGEFCDEDKSGKSVESRPLFQQVISDIESGKDNVDYLLVKTKRYQISLMDLSSGKCQFTYALYNIMHMVVM